MIVDPKISITQGPELGPPRRDRFLAKVSPELMPKIQQKPKKRPTSYHYKIKKYQTPQVCRGSGVGPIRYHCPLS